MGSINKVILIGNLGADPEVRYTASGQAVANMRLATTEKYKDRDGNLQEKTEWHRVVAWGKQAELARDYLRRGRQIYVEGSLQTREYTDKDGIKRYSTEVRSNQIVFLGPREGAGAPAPGPRPAPPEGHGGGWGGAPSRSAAPPPASRGYGPPQPPPPGPLPEDEGYFPEPPGGISDEDIPF